MGCEYYICKYLGITFYNDNYIRNITLEKQNGYYHFTYDSDNDDYDEKLKEYIKNCLTPKNDKIIIYENNYFKKELYKEKYKNIIEDFLKIIKKSWCDIKSVEKFEYRYQRT